MRAVETFLRTMAALAGVLLGTQAPQVIAAPAGALQPLPPEAVTSELDTDFFTGIRPSPDGEWLAFNVSDGRESLVYEYPSQSFTHTGYSMWSSLSIFRLRLLEVKTGRLAPLDVPGSINWGGSWSPDGDRYAFYSDRSGRAAVWIWDRGTGTVKQVSQEVPRTFRNTDAPLWTNDGKNLIFKTFPEGTTIEDFERMAPDYRKAVAKSAGTPLSPTDVPVNVYSALGEDEHAVAASEPWSWDYGYLADIVIANLESGSVRRLARRVRPLYAALSPDGRALAALNLIKVVPHTQRIQTSLQVYPLDGRRSRVLADDVVPADPAAFNWSPGSDRLVYASHEGAALETREAYVVRVSDGRKTRLSSAIGEKIGSLRWGAPLWSEDGNTLFVLDTPEPGTGGPASHLWSVSSDGKRAREVGRLEGRRIDDIVRSRAGNTFWSPDGGTSLIVRTHALMSKQEGFFAVDSRAGEATKLTENDVFIHKTLVGADRDKTQVSFFQEDASHAVEVYVLDVGRREMKQLTNLHTEFAKVPLGRTRLVEWLSERGEPLQGTLLLPPGAAADGPLPLVVWVYGGSKGSDALNHFGFGWGSMFNMQMLATRGYAVFFPDVPLHAGTPSQDILSAVIPGVNKLVETHLADPERLAVMGQSFGGYCTLALITHSSRFKAAVITGSAPADLFEGYTRFVGGSNFGVGYYERGQGGMRGTPWELPERYFENSPSFFLDRVETPLLIARGTSDEISEGSGAVFNALKRLGKPVQLLEYEQEGHELQRPADLVDFWNRRIAWLDRYMQAR